MADDLMREIAALLAEDGIDLDNPRRSPTRRRSTEALDRAIKRRNVALFTPVGEADIGVALDLLITILSGRHPESPASVGRPDHRRFTGSANAPLATYSLWLARAARSTRSAP